ncbi:MAG TPA: HipA domain-containing protein [Candidatus Scybalomonas excrementigallinarum]|nr:HipA domain-containing protein [Candidatus Scybalomonas excrementigallinarum]
MEHNFKNSKVNRLKWYGGANGNKIGISYQENDYMLKFPPKPSKNKNMSYTNSCISEYIACHIFQSLGINTQETLLGKYGDKITVACKDFTSGGFELKDFAQLKNTIIDSQQNGYGTELNDILNTIHEQQIISPVELEKFFWDMFIVDALLGNFDRHNGNWGFLVNYGTGEVKIAPIFDCGSCLYPQIEEKQMEYVLQDKKEIEKRIFVFPTSAIKVDEMKLNYFDFLNTTDNINCLKSLKDISNKIDMNKINSIIEGTPYISEIHKRFLKTMVRQRKEQIIDKSLERIYDRKEKLKSRYRGYER